MRHVSMIVGGLAVEEKFPFRGRFWKKKKSDETIKIAPKCMRFTNISPEIQIFYPHSWS